MKTADIPKIRLHSQQLEKGKFIKPDRLLSWLAAIQAQDYQGAKWSLGLRLPWSTEAMIEQALSEKKMVRTWLMRGTLHFVAASDVRWMLNLLAPRIISRNARRYRELELDEPTLARSNEVLENALQEGEESNRRDLLLTLEENGISTKGQRAAYLLQRASLDGLICQSVTIRNNPSYISLDSLPKNNTIKPEYGLLELAKRYFTTRGPATLKDFVWWSGLLMADAREGLEGVMSDLVSEDLNGKTYWRTPHPTLESDLLPKVHLLPSFDEFLISYKDRSASLVTPSAQEVAVGNHFKNTIIRDGQVIGTWKRDMKNDGMIITSKLFRKLDSKENNALKSAGKRYGEFLGTTVYYVK